MTSNEDSTRVRGSGPQGAVTQGDVDDTARKMAAANDILIEPTTTSATGRRTP